MPAGGPVRQRAGEQDRQPLGGDADAGLVEGHPVDRRVAPQRHEDRQRRDQDRRDREPALDGEQAERQGAHAEAERDVPVMGQHRETGGAEHEELCPQVEALDPRDDEHPAQDHDGGQDVGHQIRDEPGQRGERRADQDRQRDVGGPRGLQQGAPGQHAQQGHDQGRLGEDDPPFRQRRRGGEMREDGPDDRADDPAPIRRPSAAPAAPSPAASGGGGPATSRSASSTA